MTPYMSFLLQPFLDILKAFSSSSRGEHDLWSCVIETLSKSFSLDDAGKVPHRRYSFNASFQSHFAVFWRDDKLRQITTPLVEQVAVCIILNANNGKPTLATCLTNLMDCVTDDTLLKSINLNVLMHARSDDARLRLFSLTCSEKLWRTHGGKLLGRSPALPEFSPTRKKLTLRVQGLFQKQQRLLWSVQRMRTIA